MKKIIIIFGCGILMIKEWCFKHKKLLKKFAIGCACLVGFALVAVIGLYAYLSIKYPSEIVMDGVYTDVSIMDFEFSNRDLSGTYETDGVTKIIAYSEETGKDVIGKDIEKDTEDEKIEKDTIDVEIEKDTIDVEIEKDTIDVEIEKDTVDVKKNEDIANGIEKAGTKEGQIIIDGENAIIDGNNIIINAEGTYILSGEFNGHMIIVVAGASDKVQVVLNSCIISNDEGPAFYIKSADKVFITLAEGTANKISDGKEYTYTDDENDVDAALFSKSDLTINGKGKLTVEGNCSHGIVSKDDLVIGDGIYDITSAKKALNGKDCVKIYTCDMTINAGTDGIASNNDEDADRGFVYIQNGKINIKSGNDGIQAETVLKLDNPIITVCAGGGSINAPERVEKHFGRGGKGREAEAEANAEATKSAEQASTEATQSSEETNTKIVEAAAESTESMKGLKAGKDILISGGEYIIDTVDDAVHANGSINIEGGSFKLKSGDDGVHADNTLNITGGHINIEKCYEGLEAYQVAISGGEIFVISSDDGVNASVGSENGSEEQGFVDSIKGFLAPWLNGKFEITGGFLAVNTEGDGLDSNGVMTISGGKTYVAGPTSGGNDAFDCDHMSIKISETEEGDTFVVEITKERFTEIVNDNDNN